MDFPFTNYKEVLISTIVIQSCISAVGYVGNVITCVVIVSNKTMRTTTNIYLFNLAVADIVMLTTGLKYYTTRIWYMSKNKLLYGLKRNCFIISWIVHTAFIVSMMTIMAFTMERYLAICHPFLARRILSIPRAVKLIFVIWITGTVFGYLITYHHHILVIRNKTFCVWDNATPYVLEIESLVFFALPFMVLLILYFMIGRKLAESSKIRKNQRITVESSSDLQGDDHNVNKKVFNMLITVVAVFFVSWAPFHIGRLLHLHLNKWLPDVAGNHHKDGYCILIIIHSIAYFISSTINPIIYNAMSNKFRDAFKKLLVKVFYNCRCKLKVKTEDISEEIVTNV